MLSPLRHLRLRPVWVKGGCGRQADGIAGLPPASEIRVRSGTYASCQSTKSLRSSPLRGGKSRETGSQLRKALAGLRAPS